MPLFTLYVYICTYLSTERERERERLIATRTTVDLCWNFIKTRILASCLSSTEINYEEQGVQLPKGHMQHLNMAGLFHTHTYLQKITVGRTKANEGERVLPYVVLIQLNLFPSFRGNESVQEPATCLTWYCLGRTSLYGNRNCEGDTTCYTNTLMAEKSMKKGEVTLNVFLKVG